MKYINHLLIYFQLKVQYL